MSINDEEFINQIKESVNNVKGAVSKLKKLENSVDNYFRSYFDENDYEYVKDLINGEIPKNTPNDINKINNLKHLIAQEYVYNVLKKDYINNFGDCFGLSDEVINCEGLSIKLK